MSIFIKTPTGKTIVIDADPNDNIHSIKTKVMQNEGTLVNELKLCFYNS